MSQSAQNGVGKFRGLVVDLDGTLLNDQGQLGAENRAALHAIAERGVHVMVATGRSEGGTQPVLEELGLEGPAMVFNGGGLWCPRRQRLLEERTLADEVRDTAIHFALEREALVVAMRSGEKVALEPVSKTHREALQGIYDLRYVEPHELHLERAMRIMVASDAWPTSAELAAALGERISRPIYMAHFPLSVLAHLRDSPMHVCDIQAPCRGKAEALRWLEEEFAIPRSQVVCVGDASNDLEMLEQAGLAVAMQNAMPNVLQIADRVIGDNNGSAIAELCRELWPEG